MKPALVTTSQFDVRPGSRPVGREGMGKVGSYRCQSSTGQTDMVEVLKFVVRLQSQLDKGIKMIARTPTFHCYSGFKRMGKGNCFLL